ncbi:MAG: hypothetical protein ACJA1E_000546 [Paracoccaceae bacterium]
MYDVTGDYTTSYAVAAIAGILNLIIVSSLLRKTKRLEPKYSTA